MRIDPKQVTLNELLRGRLFRIPDYQRAYSWERKQRDDFFTDISEITQSDHDHFMATFVCLAREKHTIITDDFQIVDIVDGQQRLTTIIILLNTIKLHLENECKDGSAVISDLHSILCKSDDNSLILLQTNHDNSNIFV